MSDSMNASLFTEGSIVTDKTAVWEVVEVLPVRGGYTYKCRLCAFLKEPVVVGMHMMEKIEIEVIEEEKLEVFSHQKPKFKFKDRVRFPRTSIGSNVGFVWFVWFENYRYKYILREEHRFEEWYWVEVEEEYLYTAGLM